MQDANNRIDRPIPYLLVTLVAVTITWVMHEFAHWSVGELFGNRMIMTLNTSYPVSGNYLLQGQEHLISAAGPLITLVEAFVVYYLMRKNSSIYLFPFLLTCLYMRTLAGMMNVIHLNDEGRISKALGLGPFVIPFLIFGILFYLVYDITRRKKLSTRIIVLTILMIMLFSSALILGDQTLEITLIQ